MQKLCKDDGGINKVCEVAAFPKATRWWGSDVGQAARRKMESAFSEGNKTKCLADELDKSGGPWVSAA
jgi:hypothetical protein